MIMKKFGNLILLLILTLIVITWAAIPALADSAQVTVKGSSFLSYTVQLLRNGTLIAQDNSFTLPGGVRTKTWTGVQSGCGYTANVFVNGVGVQSHTWPSKCVSGTTLLGCLQFNMAGEPTPWTGVCRAY
jgi:hypothetical protein